MLYRTFPLFFLLVILASSFQPVHAQHVVVAQIELGKELDPAYGTTRNAIQKSGVLFDSLVFLTKDSTIAAGAAESWTVSPDGKTYRFKLRDGAKWSDGRPVVADDFVLAFRRLMSPDLKRAPKPTYLLENVENAAEILKGAAQPDSLGVRAVSPNELEIQLNSPATYFLSILAYPSLVPVPSHIIDKLGDDWANGSSLVSNGPMKLSAKGNNSQIFEARNDHWWELDVKKITVREMQDQTSVARELISGKSDIAVFERKNQMKWVEASNDLHIVSTPVPASHYGIFNTRRTKLSNPRVRYALSLAIDRGAISKAFEFSPAFTFSPLSMWKASENVVPEQFYESFENRHKIAQRILREEGYSKDNPLKLNIIVFDAYQHDRMAEGIRSMWSSLGVEVEVQNLKTKEFIKRVYAADFDICLGYWVADYNDPLNFLSVLRKGGEKNFSAWSDKNFNRLLTSAYSEPSREARWGIYDEMESLILREAPIFVLGHPNIDLIKSRRIEEVRAGPNGIDFRSIVVKE